MEPLIRQLQACRLCRSGRAVVRAERVDFQAVPVASAFHYADGVSLHWCWNQYGVRHGYPQGNWAEQ